MFFPLNIWTWVKKNKNYIFCIKIHTCVIALALVPESGKRTSHKVT